MKNSLFTELTIDEEASLSGGETTIIIIGSGGGGKSGKSGKAGVVLTGKKAKAVGKAINKSINQGLADLDKVLTGLF